MCHLKLLLLFKRMPHRVSRSHLLQARANFPRLALLVKKSWDVNSSQLMAQNHGDITTPLTTETHAFATIILEQGIYLASCFSYRFCLSHRCTYIQHTFKILAKILGERVEVKESFLGEV
jgi:hypothetical protein